jgi:hypothetical protein
VVHAIAISLSLHPTVNQSAKFMSNVEQIPLAELVSNAREVGELNVLKGNNRVQYLLK